jgi:ABC-type Na+ efflux pump permease subunit
VAIEKWISVASLGLFIMFVAQMISICVYLTHPSHDIDPSSQIKEFVSISIAPAVILSGSAYVLGKRYGSRLAGSLVVSGGIITIIGMYYVTILVKQIQDAYLVPELTTGPYIFIAISIPVIIIGSLLFRVKPMPKRDYFFDR